LCFKQQDITDVVIGTIDTTSTAADDATLLPLLLTTLLQQVKQPLLDTISFSSCSDTTRLLIATYKTLPH